MNEREGLPALSADRGLAVRHAGVAGAYLGGAAPARDRFDLSALIAIFRRRRLVFLLIVAISVLLAAIVTGRMQRLYTASAGVIVEQQTSVTPRASADTAAPTDGRVSQETVATEIELVRSRGLAGVVLDEERLMRDPAFVAEVTRPKGMIRALLTAPEITPAQRRSAALDWLAARLDVSQVGTSNALRITFTDDDPDRAARLANAFARAYTHDQVRSQATGNRAAIVLLRSRVETLRAQARADFLAVQNYRVGNNLLSATATSLSEQEISTYNQQIATARAEAAADAARLVAARTQLATGPGSVGEAQALPVVQQLRGQRAQLSAQIAEMADRYLDTHPDLQALRKQRDELDRQIDGEVRRTLRALEANAQASAGRLSSLLDSRRVGRGTLAATNRALVPLDDLNRRAEASQGLYESYLNRYKEAVARSGAEQPSSRLVSLADPPPQPSSPSYPLNLTLGFLVGLLVGAVAAIVVDGADRGLASSADVEERLGLRHLGNVPLLGTVSHRSDTPVATVRDHPGGAFSESLRNVLASIKQAPNGRAQVVAVSSALPDEGKTTITTCLAAAAASGGARVVMIDCDASRRKLSRGATIAHDIPGLREVLRDGAALDDAVQQDARSGVEILPITGPFAHGDRLLDGGGLHRVVAKLRERFDLVLLDCPPLLPIAEAREIAALADCAALVVRWRKTPDYAVLSAIRLLPLQAIADVGVILNAVDLRRLAGFADYDAGLLYPKYKSYYDPEQPAQPVPAI